MIAIPANGCSFFATLAGPANIAMAPITGRLKSKTNHGRKVRESHTKALVVNRDGNHCGIVDIRKTSRWAERANEPLTTGELRAILNRAKRGRPVHAKHRRIPYQRVLTIFNFQIQLNHFHLRVRSFNSPRYSSACASRGANTCG
jgi:hypothetical protein